MQSCSLSLLFLLSNSISEKIPSIYATFLGYALHQILKFPHDFRCSIFLIFNKKNQANIQLE